MPTVKLAADRLRRSERLAAEASEGPQIPSPPHGKAARRPSLRPPCCSSSRIQSRGAIRRRPSPAAFPYYWGAKGRRSAPRGGGGCSSRSNRPPAPPPPKIQSRGGKRKYSPADETFPFFFAWGAKRARSAPPDLVQDVDWANLGDGPAGLIAELALANDVADYVRFRAVCSPWRRCSPAPRDLPGGGLDRRLFPRRWIMLDKALGGPRRRRFLNIYTGECIRMDLPELDEHTLLALTPEGLLLLLHRPTLVIRLLNPLTRKLTDLPPVTALLREDRQVSFQVSGVGLADATSTVAVCFSDPRVFAVAKPGDECWTVLHHGYLDSYLSLAGRFYCCNRMSVMVLDASNSDQLQPPRLLVAAKANSCIQFSRMADSLHLVDNAGELLLVHRSIYHDPQLNLKRKDNVYRVDLDAGALVPVKAFDFKGRAVFMGRRRSISVTAEAFPSLTADTLYLGFDIYSFADGTSSKEDDADDDDEMAHTSSVVDCLSHCIRGMGDQLA
ncbi:hypothetical protein EJB05_53274, partial [Eragrostis curvula]